jgi:hypothetical protein
MCPALAGVPTVAYDPGKSSICCGVHAVAGFLLGWGTEFRSEKIPRNGTEFREFRLHILL